MKTDVAVAIVGCGRMGSERAKHLRRLGVRVTVFVDELIDRAEALAADVPGAAIARSINEVTETQLDALFVCTPPGARRDAVLAATRSGLALFLEKPIATTLEDATWMRDTAAAAGILTAIGYMNRYRPGVIRARQLATSAEVLGVSCHWTSGPYGVPWWRQETLSGGPVNEQATHLVDLCRYVGGEITDVQATIAGDGETAAGLFTFRSGALGTLLYTCGAPEKGIELRLFTRSGALHLDGWEFRLTRDIADIGDTDDKDPFGLEVDAFVQAIVSGDRSKVRCDLADAYETQRVMEQLRKSTVGAREATALRK